MPITKIRKIKVQTRSLLNHSFTLEPQHLIYLRRAVALASENMLQGRGGPFGAVIVRGGQVLAESGNLVTTTNDPTAHAEVAAIRIACQNLGVYMLQGAVLYCSCEPCPMCMAAAYWAHVSEVYFAADRFAAANAGFSDAFLYEELPKPPEARSMPFVHIPLTEAYTVFQQWEKSPYKIPY